MTHTPYSIKIAPAAGRHLSALQPKEQKLIIKLMDVLSVNPRLPGAKKIDGMTGLYSEEIGTRQVVYKVDEQDVLVLLVL